MFRLLCVLLRSLLDAPEMNSDQLRKAFVNLKASFPVRPSPPPPATSPIPPLDLVYVRIDSQQPLLSPKYRGPYRVLRQTQNTVRIQIGDLEDTVNISRVKPYWGPPLAELPLPPQQGCPPGSQKQGSHVEVPPCLLHK